MSAVLTAGIAAPALANVRTICSTFAAEQEKAFRIPPGLVHAVALAESGRWLEEDGSTEAWPWTVTSGSESFYLGSKIEAIAKVTELHALGRSNIDVGCMQINLHYHPTAFANLDQAFDPDLNVAYGTKFLKSLRDETRSWGKATAFYHSRNRSRGIAYRNKVYKLWRSLRRQPAKLLATTVQEPVRGMGAGITFDGPVKRPFFSKRPSPLWKRDAIPVLRGGLIGHVAKHDP